MTEGVPNGYGAVTPFMMVDDVQAVIDFAIAAFNATLVSELRHADGRYWHAALDIAGAKIMLGTAGDGHAMRSFLHLYVPDADASFARAIDAGASIVMPVQDQFYGDRAGGVSDAQGNFWWIATQVEQLSAEELQRRADVEEA